MDRMHIAAAAENFEEAQELRGVLWMQRICLGLQQMAAAFRQDAHNPALVEAAIENLSNAQNEQGQLQEQAVALGLKQLMRGL